MTTKKSKLRTFNVKIEVDEEKIIKQIMREEFDNKRRCEYNRVDDYIKTICHLQKVVKQLEIKLERLDSQIRNK